MSSSNLLLLWSNHVATSILVWIVIAVVLLYAARKPAHELVLSLCRLIHNALRVAGRSIMIAEKRLASRNREVLLAAGRHDPVGLLDRPCGLLLVGQMYVRFCLR